jgi:hypothetical protein
MSYMVSLSTVMAEASVPLRTVAKLWDMGGADSAEARQTVCKQFAGVAGLGVVPADVQGCFRALDGFVAPRRTMLQGKLIDLMALGLEVQDATNT